MPKCQISNIKYKIPLGTFWILFFFLLLSSQFFVLQAHAAINKQVNFQGKLVDNTGLTVSDGIQYQLVFKLYNVSSGGSAIWTETQSNISVTGGIFHVALGSVTSLAGVDFNNASLYLGIQVTKDGSGNATTDSEMSPRIQFASVPYAFNADKLDGVVATQSASGFTLTGGYQNLKTLTLNDNITLGTIIQPTSSNGLTVEANGANGLTLSAGAASVFNTTAGNIKLQPAGSTTTSTVQIGEANGTGGSATPDMLVLDQASGSLPTGVKGGLIIDSTNKINYYDGTAWKQLCNLTDAGCGAGGSTSLQTAFNNGQTINFSLAGTNAGLTLGTNAGNGNVLISPNAGGQAGLIVNDQGNGDLFTASSSGVTQFVIQNNGNVGIGTNTPTEALQVEGNIKIDNAPNSTDQQAWTDLANAAGQIVSGGTSSIASISAMAIYNGSLYVGTNKTGAAEIYRYNGTGAGGWTKVSQTTAGTIASGGTSAIDMVSSMIAYNGYLYIGTQKANSAEVYQYNGGTSWTQLNITGTVGKFNTTTAIDGVASMVIFDGKLYMGTVEPAKAELYRYDGGTTWTPINTTAGTFVTTNAVAVNSISSMAVWQNELYLGTQKPAAADVLRYSGSTGASVFVKMDNTTSGSFAVDGANVTTIEEVTSMVVYQGKLTIGVRKTANGADIYTNETNTQTTTNNLWHRINFAAGQIDSGGTTNIDGVHALAVYNGRLYTGTRESGGKGEIYRYEGVKDWTKISQNTAGQIATGGTSGIDGVTQLQPYGENLLAGTADGTNAEVYTYQYTNEQSYSLVFHATSDTAGGEQNGLENDARIFYVATPSANLNSVGQPGAFIFSRSIMTNSGAYDVAEDYPTRDTSIQPGDVVTIDTSEKGLVKRATNEYDKNVIGVYSQNPALHLSQQGSQIDGLPTIPVALVGRVDVNVSTESGEISAGDYIVSSSVPGVGMKATRASPIIGQALEGYSGDGIGSISVFVQHGYFDGSSFAGQNTNTDPISEIATLQTSLQTQQNTLTNFIASTSAQIANFSQPSDTIINSLAVDGLSTISGDLRVKGNGLIEGILNIVDTLTTNNLIVSKVSDFFGGVIFHSNVTFSTPPLFNQDTAGFAVIHKDAKRVVVTFEKSYTDIPIVNLTMTFDPKNSADEDNTDISASESAILNGNYTFVVTSKTVNGFTILLNKAAEEDIFFSWVAVAVEKPKLFESLLPMNQPIHTSTDKSSLTPLVPTVTLVPTITVATQSGVISNSP